MQKNLFSGKFGMGSNRYTNSITKGVNQTVNASIIVGAGEGNRTAIWSVNSTNEVCMVVAVV